jgi:hypothetical protein
MTAGQEKGVATIYRSPGDRTESCEVLTDSINGNVVMGSTSSIP